MKKFLKYYSIEDTKKFPKQFRTMSIKDAFKEWKEFVSKPRQNKENKKPNAKPDIQ
jgi:hypothetical protein